MRSSTKSIIYYLFILLTGSFLICVLVFEWNSRTKIGYFPETKNDEFSQKIPNCPCERRFKKNFNPVYGASSCNEYASLVRGRNQKVISYSIYGAYRTPYYSGLMLNAALTKEFYPGWVMRVYHNVSSGDREGMDVICDLACRFDHVDFCDVAKISPKIGKIGQVFARLWRFLVLGDPSVQLSIIRDTDSLVSQREVDAVQDWICSNKTWHVMRDHKYHTKPIMAGMWGFINKDKKKMLDLRRQIIQKGSQLKFGDSIDQQLLESIVWPIAQKDMKCHDSYLCQRFKQCNPWPTQRIYQSSFVGARTMRGEQQFPTICPNACRPILHQDWTLC